MIAEHARLVDQLDQAGVLSRAWRAAFAAVPRHLFLPDAVWVGQSAPLAPLTRQDDPQAWLDLTYADDAVTTQVDDGATPAGQPGRYPSSSASQPSLVALMLDRLAVEPSMRVLEIGTGTGYNAALLCHRLGEQQVTTLEVDPAVAEQARRALSAAGYHPAVITTDGALGYPPGAPYDRVLATCAVRTVPYPWVAQTVPGGRIVTPWGTAFHNGVLAVLDVAADGTATGRFGDTVAFMLLRDQRHPRGSLADRVRPTDVPDESVTTLWPGDVIGHVSAAFAVGLRVPDCRYLRVDLEPDSAHGEITRQEVWCYTTRRQSWACVTLDAAGEPDRYPVGQYGPRRLWDEVEAAYAWWVDQGRPDHTRFGLTVTAQQQWTWLDTPTHRVP